MLFFNGCSNKRAKNENKINPVFWKTIEQIKNNGKKLELLDSLELLQVSDLDLLKIKISKFNPLIELGKLDIGLKCAQEAEQLAKKLKNDSLEIVAIKFQGNAHYMSNQFSYDKPIYYWKLAANKALATNNFEIAASVFNNIGGIYSQRENDSSVLYLKKSINLMEKINKKNTTNYLLSTRLLATTYASMGKSSNFILPLYDSAILAGIETKDTTIILSALIYKAYYFSEAKNWNLANLLIDSAMKIGNNYSDFSGKSNLYRIKSYIDYKQGKFKIAYDTMMAENTFTRDVYSKELRDKTAALEVDYQTEKYKTELLKQEIENKQKQNILVIILIVIVFSIIGTIIYLKNIKRKNLEKDKLLAQQLETQKMQEIALALESERGKIASELHDGIMQNMTAISLNIKHHLISENLKNSKVYEILNLVNNTATEIRTLSHQMMPPMLQTLGLEKALNTVLNITLNNTKIKYEFDYRVDNSDVLSSVVQHTVYRIIQELINNLVKHSEATLLQLIVHVSNKNLILHYEDNGVGINQNKKSGKGLDSLTNRLKLVNGNLQIETEEQKGMLAIIRIPLK